MGNDRRFIEAADLPFRWIDVPIGSAPPPPIVRQSHKKNKRHAPPIPPRHVEGYDAPPSLLPPPVLPKRFDQPTINPPPRSDLPGSFNPKKNEHHRKRIDKSKVSCCVIS